MTSKSSKDDTQNDTVPPKEKKESKVAPAPADTIPKKKPVRRRRTNSPKPASENKPANSDTSSENKETKAEVTPKPTRVRKPRKTQPKKVITVDEASEDNSKTNPVDSSEKVAGPTVQKRRGRPRKKPVEKAETTNLAKAESPNADPVQVADTVVKKKPVRRRSPRKPKVKIEESEGQNEQVVEPSKNAPQSQENPTVKKPTSRKRAPRRPNKRPVKKIENDTTIQDTSVVEETSTNQELTNVDSIEAVNVAGKGKRLPRRRSRNIIPQELSLDDSSQEQEENKPESAPVDGNKEPVKEVTPRRKSPARTRSNKSVKSTKPNRAPKDNQQEDIEKPEVEEKAKNTRLLINAEEPEECRLALLEDGKLQSIHVSTVNKAQTKSNIYKAKIVAIEPNLQAAFIDYGTSKNGFLPFSEIHPEYFKTDVSDSVREHIDARRWRRIKMEDVLERGQEMLVQVVKEEIGKKGANMTTYLSLPGRCVVLMPGSDSTGISRKISGDERRGKLRNIMRSFDIPAGIGWIVRTASVDINENALARDVEHLLKLWEEIRERGQNIEGVGLAYEDHRTVLRFLREHFDPSIQEIAVDDQQAYEQVLDFVDLLPAAQKDVKVRLHKGTRPIFNQFSVEDQIESIYQPQVNLPSGGSIVIDPTEALVAIDVNSGSTSKGHNFEESIFQANMEAASELARQLRLRDLGGLIVVDFIDMRNKRHIREVEKEVRVAMKRDKAKVDFSRISKFGLMEISRQKLGSPIEAGAYRVCTHCKGRGSVRSVETLALFYLRRIQTGASRNPVIKVECRLPLDVASYLLNNKRPELHELETKYSVEIVIIADGTFKPAENDIVFHRQEKEKQEEK
ncbi:MAG: Rne/Rng family ribonuclease [Desulfotalea sp.]